MSFYRGKRPLRRLPLFMALSGALSMAALPMPLLAQGEERNESDAEVVCDKAQGGCERDQASMAGGGEFNTDPQAKGLSIALKDRWGASSDNMINIGNGAGLTGPNGPGHSVAVGSNAYVGSTGAAFGSDADAIGTNVALGADSQDRSGIGSTVAVGWSLSGQSWHYRRIAQLAPGIADTDAVNVKQLSPMLAAMGMSLDESGKPTQFKVKIGDGFEYYSLADAFNNIKPRVPSYPSNAFDDFLKGVNDGQIGLLNVAGNVVKVGAGSGADVVDFASRTTPDTSVSRKLSGLHTDGDVLTGGTLFAQQELYGANKTKLEALQQKVRELQADGLGLVINDQHGIAIGRAHAGDQFSVSNDAGEARMISGVASASVAKDATDLATGADLNRLDALAADAVVSLSGLGEQLAAVKQMGEDYTAPNDGLMLEPDMKELRLVEGTRLSNVQGVELTEQSTALVNGGQLYDFQQSMTELLGGIEDRIAQLEEERPLPEFGFPAVDPEFGIGFDDSEEGIAVSGAVPFAAEAAPRVVQGVGAGIADTDGVNVGQVSDLINDAVKQARDHVDGLASSFNSSLQSFDNEVQRGMDARNTRLDRIGAMNAASTHMAINAAGAKSNHGRAAIGVGMQSDKGAVALGYARALNERTQVTVGGAFSGPEKSAGVGLSVSL